MLTGKRTSLRAVETTDYPLVHRWLNDPDTMFYLGLSGNTLSLSEVAEAERLQAARGNSRKYIIMVGGNKPIGLIDYYDLNWVSASAWVSILIGERDYWGGGYGTDAMHTLLAYLFGDLGLHRVSLTAHETNERAIKSYEKNGFVKEGLLREWSRLNRQWVNGVLMSVLERDFEL